MPAPRKPTVDPAEITRLSAEIAEVRKLALQTAGTTPLPTALEAEVAVLRRENAALKAELLAARPAASAADLAHALRDSLDDLQQACARMDNPVSDFAVREFSLQANVVLHLDALGQAHYRFLAAGEPVDERALSRISVSFVPLPKPTPQGSAPARGGDRIDIEAIDGIGDVTRQTLNRSDVYTVADLLRVGTRVRNRLELAALLGVDREKLSRWLDEAELMALPDVGVPGARALRRSGVGSVEELAGQRPEALGEALKARLKAEEARQLGPLEEARVRRWIDAARTARGLGQEERPTPLDAGAGDARPPGDAPGGGDDPTR